MADKYGTELSEGDLAMWCPPTTAPDGEPDASGVEIVKVLNNNRYMIEFWRNDDEPPLWVQQLHPELQALVAGGEKIVAEADAYLAEHGVGAGALPLDSPLVVPGSELISLMNTEDLWNEDLGDERGGPWDFH